MEDFKPAERITALTKVLIENPYQLFPLKDFAEQFSVAKSTLSEDIAVMKTVFKKMNMGQIETLTGAAGGIRYVPALHPGQEKDYLNKLVQLLNDRDRILPGGFLYMTDIIFSSIFAWQIGQIFASRFKENRPDYIVTIETKGIPIAMMTARAFNIPLVTIRRNSRVTEGTVVSINYLSGSSVNKIQTMSLARRTLPAGAKVLIIDDFLKAGGTAKGMLELLKEFDVQVEGVGVLVETVQPRKKLIVDYLSLLTLEEVSELEKKVKVTANF